MNNKSIFLTIIAASLLSGSVYAQQALDDAFQKAKKEDKIVMLVVESANCNECNEVGSKGLSNEQVKSAISKDAILFKVKKIPELLQGPGALYLLPTEFFGVLFFDAEKNILDIMPGSSSRYAFYLEHIGKALKEKQSTEASFSELKKNYFNNIGSFDAIKKLIEKIRKLNLEPQQQLLDELTQKAPEDSATAISFLQFIMRAAPTYGSVAEQYIQKNRDNYNMAWYRMNMPERVIINGRIYAKSLLKAIRDKDINYAYRVSSNRQMNFSGSPNPEEMQKASQETMLQYYLGVRDTSNYLKNVVSFYDRFYMTTKVETIVKEDSIRKATLFKNAVPTTLKTAPSSTELVRMSTVSFAPRTQFYAAQLNNGAWTIYTFTKDNNYLSKALSWVKRGLEFYESPASMDTYARLLYKTGNKEEAVNWEQKAIDANNKKSISSAEFEKVLGLMKTKAERIDEY